MRKLKNKIIIFLILIFALTPLNVSATEQPTVVAQAAVLMELNSGNIIYEKNIHNKMYPASTTKILTSLVLLDHFKEDELITVGGEIYEIPDDSSKARLYRGETLTVKNLLRGIIIPSGNEAANVAAVAVAKKIKNNNDLAFKECESTFAELMNEKAKSLGCVDSHFANAHGYHDDNHYISAYDMALIAAEGLKNPILKEVASETEYSGEGIENKDVDSSLVIKNHSWVSHNNLIMSGEYYYKYANGIKTGYTNQAGSCVVASATKNDVTLIAVILNSGDTERWVDAKDLFEYGFNNYEYIQLQKKGDILQEINLKKHNRLQGDTINAIANEDVSKYLEKGRVGEIKKEIKLKPELTAENKDGSIYMLPPITKGQAIADITYSLDDEILYSGELYSDKDIEKSTFLNTIKFYGKFISSKLPNLKFILVVVGITVALIAFVVTIIILRRKRRRTFYRYNKYKFPKKKGRRF